MPTYRAYLLDKDDKVETFRPIDANSDDEALSAAKQFVDGHDVEVWLLDKMIGRLSKRVL